MKIKLQTVILLVAIGSVLGIGLAELYLRSQEANQQPLSQQEHNDEDGAPIHEVELGSYTHGSQPEVPLVFGEGKITSTPTGNMVLDGSVEYDPAERKREAKATYAEREVQIPSASEVAQLSSYQTEKLEQIAAESSDDDEDNTLTAEALQHMRDNDIAVW